MVLLMMMIIIKISLPGCRSSKQLSIVSFQHDRRTPTEMMMIILGDADDDDENVF